MVTFARNTSLYLLYAVDADKENDGVWVDGKPPIAFKVRSMTSTAAKAAQKVIDQRNKPYWRGNTQIPDAVAEQNEIEIALACLVDWRDIADDAGAHVAYTPELGRQLFADTAFIELRRFVIGAANNSDNFRPDAKAPAAA